MEQTLNTPVRLSRKEKYRRKTNGTYHPIVWFLIVGTAVTRVASFMSLPFLAIHLSDDLRLNSFTIGIILGMSGLTGAIGGFIGGYLSDRWGRRPIMLIAFAAWTGVFFGFWFADKPFHFLILNGLNGLCRAFFEPTSQALMADVSRPEQRLRIFNLRYVAINVGMVVGPVIGSYLYYLVSTQVFLYTGVVYAIYLFFLFRISSRYRRDTTKGGGERIRFSECLGVIRRDQALGCFVLAGILFFTVYAQIDSSLPIFLAQLEKGQLYPALLAINAGIVVLFQYFVSRWTEKKSILTSLLVGSCFVILGFFSFAAGEEASTFITGIVFITFGEILIFPVSSLFIDRLADDRLRGTYYGANQFSQMGLFLGPLVGGWLLEVVGGRNLWWLMVLITLYIIWFYALGYRKYARKKGYNLVDVIRRVLVDLRMVSLLKSAAKSVPLLTLIVLSVLLSYRLIEDRLEAPPRTQTVQIQITPEANLFEIGKQLESKQLIHNYILFPIYSTSYSLFKQVYIQPGVYQIPREMGLEEIMYTLSRGTYQVVIPEGATVSDIATILSYYGVQREEFLRAANGKDYPFDFVQQIPDDRPYRLEGYLQPGKYEFRVDATAKEIVETMLYRFDQMLDEETRGKLKKGNLSIDQWVIVSSLIEQIEPHPSNRPYVARLMYDRLNRGQKLGIWSLPQPYSRIKRYYTSLYPGLPPGPINNPGKDALKSAINPADK
ncbi:cell division protein YceG involved in septum cleavage [Planifilum fimeticola]|uniref:Cell division protein YceG involved in septum cleavage n=1 Tax=Planifilum fimeticola TaxID=201975 RepID=A0A2T0LI38_9BACL|nr:endolytic transglycosylase MltG [Planifilum fimeticola]PRX42078.1 cell division protein YceG involved in septum cleavage [Planifilum fimeticola]